MLSCEVLDDLRKLVKTMNIVDNIIVKKEGEKDKKKNKSLETSKCNSMVQLSKQKPSTSRKICCKFRKENLYKNCKNKHHVQFKLCEIKAMKLKRRKDTFKIKYLPTEITSKSKEKVLSYLYSERYLSCGN